MESAKAFFLYSLTIIMILAFIGIAIAFTLHMISVYKHDKRWDRAMKEHYKEQLKEKDNEQMLAD